jgi:hypothetical protein
MLAKPGRDLDSDLGAARLLARLHHDDEARAIVDSIARVGKRAKYINEGLVAGAYAELGDVDRTLEWLERTRTSQGSFLGVLYVQLAGTRLQGNPRIVEFGRRIGLPDPPPYWR